VHDIVSGITTRASSPRSASSGACPSAITNLRGRRQLHDEDRAEISAFLDDDEP